jgi:hypothetical protein
MIASRLQIKLFLENPDALELSALTGVFQRWIQDKALEGLLIDVADYRHVFQGPGVVLIGHESDYGLDLGAGRPGLLYTRKHHPDDSLENQLRGSLYLALSAAKLLESEPLGLKFRTDEVEIRFVDRLQFPNLGGTIEDVRDDADGTLAALYGGVPVQFDRLSTDSRQVFTLKVEAKGAPGVATLLSQFQAAGVHSGILSPAQ